MAIQKALLLFTFFSRRILKVLIMPMVGNLVLPIISLSPQLVQNLWSSRLVFNILGVWGKLPTRGFLDIFKSWVILLFSSQEVEHASAQDYIYIVKGLNQIRGDPFYRSFC